MALRDLGLIEEATEEELEELGRDAEDVAWWNEHAQEFEAKYRGKHLTVINKELFVGDTHEEVYRQAKSRYPEQEPFVDYIPYKKFQSCDPGPKGQSGALDWGAGWVPGGEG